MHLRPSNLLNTRGPVFRSQAWNTVWVFGLATLTTCLATVLPNPIHGQALPSQVSGAEYNPSLKFDIASIRESAPAGPYSQGLRNPARAGTFDANDIYVSQIVAEAFGVNFRYQLSGGPEWLDQRYVVHAKSDPATDARLVGLTLDQAKLEKQGMLRGLLTDRFGFKGHVEVRIGTVYFLTVAKPSPNFREASGNELAEPSPGIRTGGSPADLKMKGRGATMQQLASLMSYYLRNEVIDQTGLTKSYDFEIRFNARPEMGADPHDDAGPAEVAFPEQIGLKLARGKGPVKMVIIDSITRPSPN